MAESDNNEKKPDDVAPQEAVDGSDAGVDAEAIERSELEAAPSEVVGQEQAAIEDPAAGQMGVQRYVHASFFGAGILAAYLGGKIALSAWNSLSEWPAAVRSLPVLIEYTEDERASITLVIGAVLGLFLILRYYRRPSVRSWATDVASELSRVTWPNKDTVTNGTIVVLVAGAVATLYIALLDRLWGYLSNLIYGA
jgi:preprotein translocase subunit SecE